MRLPVEQYKNKFNIRQTMWDEILKKKVFKKWDFIDFEGHRTTKFEYIDSLEKAGFIKRISVDEKFGAIIYKLICEKNKLAPNLNKNGIAVFEGKLNQKMWQIIKIQKVFSAKELSEISGAKHSTVKAYLRYLTNAGYLVRFKDGLNTMYRFLPSKNTGYYAPMIKRTKELYDPNLGKIVNTEAINYELA